MTLSSTHALNTQWLVSQASQYKKPLLWANLIALLATLISVPIPLLMPILVDEVLLDKPATGLSILNYFLPNAWHSPVAYIITVLVLVVLMRISSQIFNIIQTRQFTLISKTLTCYIRQQLLDKLGRISMQQYEHQGSGALTSHLVTDIETIDKFIGSSLSRFVISLLTTIGIAGILLYLDWKLGLFIILLNPVIIYLSKLMGQKVKQLKKKENQSFERFQQRLVETLDGLYQLRAANREHDYLQRLKDDANNIRIDADNYAWQSDAAGRVSFLCFLLGFEVFRALAMVMVLFGDMTIGQTFAVFSYLWFMLSPIQDLLNIQYSWYSASAAMKRLNDVLELEEEHRPVAKVNLFQSHDKSTPSSMSSPQQIDINIHQVNFSYHKDQQILKNLSLHIPAGKRVALVGASGGGKSTLIQLLLGIYQKESGDILINNHPIEHIGYQKVREQLATVLQHPIIFNDSLRENLTLGKTYSDEELYAALDIAQLTNVVAELPEKLDSQLGRQGIKLSGGQRQRLAIARMVLSKPKLVILDEATSALDTATESALHKALDTFLEGRTTLIVAHRLSAVKNADLIYVLEDGQVVQSGQHHELVSQDGLYQTLYGSLQT